MVQAVTAEVVGEVLVRIFARVKYRTPITTKKTSHMKGRLRFTGNKNFGRYCTEVSVERARYQIRTPTWTSFPVSY